jgi:hypothetical protein
MSVPAEQAYYFPVPSNSLGMFASKGDYLSKSSFEEHFNLLLVAPFLIYVGWTNVSTTPNSTPLHNNFYRVLYITGGLQFLWSLYNVYKIHQNIFLVAILACCAAILYLIIYSIGNRPVCNGPPVTTSQTDTKTAPTTQKTQTKTEEELEDEDEE